MGRLYDAVRRDDQAAVGSLIHDDIDWLIFGPVEIFPFQGPRRGKTAVLAAMAEIASQYSLERHTEEIVIIDGERAAVLANVAFVQRATDRMLTFKVANFLRFQDGLLTEFRELSDTFDVTQQALGRWLKV